MNEYMEYKFKEIWETTGRVANSVGTSPGTEANCLKNTYDPSGDDYSELRALFSRILGVDDTAKDYGVSLDIAYMRYAKAVLHALSDPFVDFGEEAEEEIIFWKEVPSLPEFSTKKYKISGDVIHNE